MHIQIRIHINTFTNVCKVSLSLYIYICIHKYICIDIHTQ